MKYKTFFFLVLFLSPNLISVKAQTSKIDSLETLLLNHKKEDTLKVKLLNEVAIKFYGVDADKAIKYATKAIDLSDSLKFTKGKAGSLLLFAQCQQLKFDFHKSIEFTEKALKIYEELGNRSKISSCYGNIGAAYLRQADYLKALEYYQKSLKISKELGDKKITATCYNDIGIIYYQRGDLSKTLEYFLKTLKIYEEIDNKKSISITNNNIGGIYQGQGDYENALVYHQKSLIIAEELGDKWGIASSNNNIGGIYQVQGDYKNALVYHQKSLKIAEELGDKSGVADNYFNIGGIYQGQGDYTTALEYYQKSLKISIEIGDKYTVAAVYNELSVVYFKQRKIKKAYSHSSKAYTMANKIGNAMLIKRSSEMLAKCSDALGMYRDAYKYHVVYKNMYDSLYNEKNVKEITNLENRYQFNKEKEAIGSEQDKKDAINDAEMKRQKQLRNTFIGGAIVFLILAIIILFNLIQKRKANQVLAEQKEEIQTQNEKLVELDSFKEGMTGMIVHDLKNPLNAIINVSNDIKAKQSGKQMLNMVMNILDVAKYEQTCMVIDKSAYSLLELSRNAIDEVLFLVDQKSILITNNIKPEIGIKGDKEIIERIFINLLTNAIKYTPNNGSLDLKGSLLGTGFVEVKVSDSGEGIPADKLNSVFDKFGQLAAKSSGKVRSTGLGLTFCKMAVEAHGGSIKVESKVASGTTFIFTLEATDNIETGLRQKQIICEKSVLIFTELEKEILKPHLEKLQMLMVYESSQIKAILKEVDEQERESIHKWKEEMQQCLFAMNEEKYKELIK
jgi:signal transduction histidine kinase/Tfp pilus assembly protein PilF